MFRPVWDARDVSFVELIDSRVSCPHIRITSSLSVLDATFLEASLCSAHTVWVHYDVSATQQIAVLTALRNCASLRSLVLECLMEARHMEALSAVLDNAVQLQHLKLFLGVSRCTSDLFHENLQLTALCLNSTVSVYANQLNTSLRWLELGIRGSLRHLSKLAALKELRVLRIRTPLEHNAIEDLIVALDSLPLLEEFRVHMDDLQSVSAVAEFFGKARALRTLGCVFPYRVPQELLVRFWTALRDNTRLQHLIVGQGGDMSPSIAKSGLISAGWLCDIESEHVQQSLIDAASRNHRRHVACLQACVSMMALRKRKIALVSLGVDVVRMIAMRIWETRNSPSWDIVRDASGITGWIFSTLSNLW